MPRLDRRFLSLAALLVGLSACATDTGTDGPFYPQGFSDGCRTAEARQASFDLDTYRDAVLFRTDRSYRSGWRSGYQQCDRTQDFDNRPGDLGEQSPY